MTKYAHPFSLLSPFLALLILSGCQGQGSSDNPTPPEPTPLPSGATSVVGTPLPKGFTTINPETGLPVTQKDWDQWQKDGRLLTYNADGGAANDAIAAEQLQQAEVFSKILVATNPRLAKLLADPDSSDATTSKLADGNFLHTITVKKPLTLGGANVGSGATTQFQVKTLGSRSKTLMLGNGAARFLGAPDLVFQNQLAIYTRFYNQIKRIQPLLLDRYSISVPSTLAGSSVETVKNMIQKFQPIFKDLAQVPAPKPSQRPNPAQEFGAGTLDQLTLGDRIANECVSMGYYDSDNNKNYPSLNLGYTPWPMEFWETSIKHQGSRGSCVAFAITAAMEADISQKYGYWMNLSEQDLYYHMKAYWAPIGDSYGDGADPHGIFDKMKSFTWTDALCSAAGGGEACVHNTNYHIPLENQWEYNPSINRIEDSDKCGMDGYPACTRTYTHSCERGYSPDPTHFQDFCSETNHQGQPVCIEGLGYNFCGYLTSVAQNAATQGPPSQNAGNGGGQIGQPYFASGDAEIWDTSDPDKSIALMTWGLIFQTPMVASIVITPSWDSNKNGYTAVRHKFRDITLAYR